VAPLSESDGDVVEVLAVASYLDLEYREAIAQWERAYAAHRASGDELGAIRVARTLAYMYGSFIGDWAIGGGWMSRALTLLADAPDSSQAGWVSLNAGMFEGDRAVKEERFRVALEIGRRHRDSDLECATLAYLGASLVHSDRTEEGMILLDEALASVAGGDVDDFIVVEEVFCQLFSACEHAHDVNRAEQWIRIGDAIASSRNLPVVTAFCRTHYGGVLTAAGRWPEADATLSEAIRLWGLGRRSALREGAVVRLADLRVRQGRFEEGEQLLSELDVNTNPDAARPLAAICLGRGETERARDILERALAQIDATSTGAAPLLTLLVDVDLASGDLVRAEQSVNQLAACTAGHRNEYLHAVASLARGRVYLASGTGDPQECLRDALAGFARAQTPMEVARCRLELAGALLNDRPEVALAEARAAFEAFEQLQAARDVDAAAAMLRSLGARPASARPSGSVLTKRENEVLVLVGHGLSNPEISDRLFISRKTVEHHVGNILAKLGLRSRAEAAAYSARMKPE
jgi:DNA-binding CsgD family transcriptional regulator